MGRRNKRMSESDADTRLIYKRSNYTLQTHSKTNSGVSQLTRSDIQQLKKALSPDKGFYVDDGKMKRDLSIETDICVLRRYFKHKRNKIINKDAKSVNSRLSDYTDIINTIEEKNPNDSASGDNLKNKFNVDVTSIMVNNFKELLTDWTQQHVVQNKSKQNVVDHVFEAVLDKLQAQKPVRLSASGTTYVMDKKIATTDNVKVVTSTDYLYLYCIHNSSTMYSSWVESETSSRYSMPNFDKNLKKLSTLSIPRNCNKHQKGIRRRRKKRKLKVINGNQKNLFVSDDKSIFFPEECPSMLVIRKPISKKAQLNRCVNYSEKQINLTASLNSIMAPVILLSESSFVSASVFKNALGALPKDVIKTEVCRENTLLTTDKIKTNTVKNLGNLKKKTIDDRCPGTEHKTDTKVNTSQHEKFIICDAFLKNNATKHSLKDLSRFQKTIREDYLKIEPKTFTNDRTLQLKKVTLTSKNKSHTRDRQFKQKSTINIQHEKSFTRTSQSKNLIHVMLTKPEVTNTQKQDCQHQLKQNFTKFQLECDANMRAYLPKKTEFAYLTKSEQEVDTRNITRMEYETSISKKHGGSSKDEKSNTCYNVSKKDDIHKNMYPEQGYHPWRVREELFGFKPQEPNYHRIHRENYVTTRDSKDPTHFTQAMFVDQVCPNAIYHDKAEYINIKNVEMNKPVITQKNDHNKSTTKIDKNDRDPLIIDFVNKSFVDNHFTTRTLAVDKANKKNSTQYKKKTASLYKRTAKKKKLLFRKPAPLVPKFEDIHRKDFRFLCNKVKGNMHEENDFLSHFLDIYQYFMNFESTKSINLDVHVNVFPVFDGGTEVDLSQTSKNGDPKEVKTTPTLIYHITSKNGLRISSEENRTFSFQKSASHCLGFKPEIIPLLDTAFSKNKYITGKESSLVKYNSAVKEKAHLTDRSTNTVDAAVVEEICQLKTTIMELTTTAQLLFKEHKLKKKKKRLQEDLVKLALDLDLKNKKLTRDTGKYLKSNTTKGSKNKLIESKTCKRGDRKVVVIQSEPNQNEKQTKEHCELYILRQCRHCLHNKNSLKGINNNSRNKKHINDGINIDKENLNQKTILNNICINKSRRKSRDQKGEENNNFRRESKLSTKFHPMSSKKSHSLAKRKQKKGINEECVNKRVPMSCTIKNTPNLVLSFNAGPKKNLNYESEKKLPEPNISFRATESETSLAVINTMSSVNGHDDAANKSQALTVSGPHTGSLGEFSSTTTMVKPKTITCCYDATIPSLMKATEKFVSFTPCVSNDIKKCKKILQPEAIPDDEYKEPRNDDIESCESMMEALQDKPNAFIVKCSDCNREFTCSSVHSNNLSQVFKVQERRHLGKAEGVFYCLLLWAPVFMLIFAFYQLIILDPSKKESKLAQNISEVGLTIVNKTEFVKMSDLGF